VPEPDGEGRDFKSFLNPHSLEIVAAKVEPSLQDGPADQRYQFERLGYFCSDILGGMDDGGHSGRLVMNRTITLRDTWAREFHKT